MRIYKMWLAKHQIGLRSSNRNQFVVILFINDYKDRGRKYMEQSLENMMVMCKYTLKRSQIDRKSELS